MPHAEHFHKNFFQPDAIQQEHQSRDEIDAVAEWQPEGGIVIDARVAGANGGQDIIEVNVAPNGETHAEIDGKQVHGEQVVQLGKLLGVKLADTVDPNNIEVTEDSPLQDSLNH